MKSSLKIFVLLACLCLTFAENFNVNSGSSKMGTIFTQSGSGGELGNSVADIGDVNGDGISDYIIGSPSYLNSVGRAAVIYGTSNGLPNINIDYMSSKEGFIISGAGTRSIFGKAVAAAGDVNGDKIPDYVIGAPGFNNSIGAVYVLYGKRDSSQLSFAINDLTPAQGFKIYATNSSSILSPEQQIGYSVDGGDFNGDGISDIIIGAPSDYNLYYQIMFLKAFEQNSNASPPTPYGAKGLAVVAYGKNSTTRDDLNLDTAEQSDIFPIVGNSNTYYLGTSVSAAGDINGDGKIDILIGSAGSTAVLVYGSSSDPGFVEVLHPLSNNHTLIGTDSIMGFGTNVFGGGDYNGDGKKDFIFGALYGQAVVVYSSAIQAASIHNVDDISPTQRLIIGTNTTDFLFAYGATYGDINNDGIDDIIIGSPFSEGDSSVNIIFGSKTPVASLNITSMTCSQGFRVLGANDTALGASVSTRKPKNSNFVTELLVTAPTAANSDGKVYVISDLASSSGCPVTTIASETKKQPLGLIIGVAIGGTVAIVLVIWVLFKMCKKSPHKYKIPESAKGLETV